MGNVSTPTAFFLFVTGVLLSTGCLMLPGTVLPACGAAGLVALCFLMLAVIAATDPGEGGRRVRR